MEGEEEKEGKVLVCYCHLFVTVTLLGHRHGLDLNGANLSANTGQSGKQMNVSTAGGVFNKVPFGDCQVESAPRLERR